MRLVEVARYGRADGASHFLWRGGEAPSAEAAGAALERLRSRIASDAEVRLYGWAYEQGFRAAQAVKHAAREE